MFSFLAASLVFGLLSFGAVLPHSALLLAIIWLIAFAVVATVSIARKRPGSEVLLILVTPVLVLPLGPKLALGLFAGVWAYLATLWQRHNVLRFYRFLVLVGVLEAFLGLLQYFLVPGWIFNFQNPFYRSSGTLINHNHFAGLLEMLIPVALACAYIATERFGDFARSYMSVLAASFMGLAVLFAISRMGILSAVTTILFLGFIVRVRHSQKRLPTGLALGVIGLVLAGALWIGIDSVVLRYSELAGSEALLREGRVLVFADTIRMIKANPLGIGIGRYQDVFRQYQTYRPELLFDHAHNDYLETIAEWGLPIAITFWVSLFFLLYRSVRAFFTVSLIEQRGALLACIGAILSILVHSLTDFNLQIPSNAMLFFTFVGIGSAGLTPWDAYVIRGEVSP
jgi:O-antigen ligase